MKKYLILCIICLLSVSQVWAANNTTLVITLTDAGGTPLTDSDLSAGDIALFSATLKWKNLTINVPGSFGKFFKLPNNTWALQISLQGFNSGGDVPIESVDPVLSATDLTITTNLGETVNAVIKRKKASGTQQETLDITPPAVLPKISLSSSTICADGSTTNVTIKDAPADLLANYTISVTPNPANFSVSPLDDYPIEIKANTGTAAGSYTVKLMKNGTPPTEVSSTELTVGATPSLTISATQKDGADAYYCKGTGAKNQVTLTASPVDAYSYQWSGSSTAKTARIDVSTAGKYTVTATSSGAGCPAKAEIDVKEHTRPGGVTIINSVADVCANAGSGSTTLTPGTASAGSGGGTPTYVWSGSSINASSGVVSNETVSTMAAGTTYTLTVSDNKCSSMATHTLKGHKLVVSLTPATKSVASGTEVDMTATPIQTPAQSPAGISYVWTGDVKTSSGASATSAAVTSGNTPLKYKVEASDAYCKDVPSDEVAYSVTAGSEVEIASISGGQACEAKVPVKATIQKGTAPYTYTWSSVPAGLTFTPATGSTSGSVASDATGVPNVYRAKLKVTDAKGVVVEKETAVKIYAKPTLTDITVTSSEICVGPGNMVTLQANGGAAATPPQDNSATLNYVWTGATKLADQTKASVTLAAGETTYKVKIVDGNYCESPERTVKHTGHQVTVVAEINNSATSVAIPYGSTANLKSTVTLNPNVAPNKVDSYEWTPVAGIDEGAVSATATTTKLTAGGSYKVEVIDNNGCRASDDVPYTVSGSALSVTAQPAYICAGDITTKLSCAVSGGVTGVTPTYLWTSLVPGLSFVDATAKEPQVAATTPAGKYRVKVQVTQGAQTAESLEVEITIGAQPKITSIGIYQGGNLIPNDGTSVFPNSVVDVIVVANAAAGTVYTWSPMSQIANISGDKLTATSIPLALGDPCFKLELKNVDGKCPVSNEACVPVRGTEFLVDMKDQTICAGTASNITSVGAISGGSKPYKNHTWTCTDPAFLFTSNGESITVSAATAPGTYTVRLEVDDAKGNHALPEDFTVTVNAVPKFIAVSTTPQTVKVGNNVTLSASVNPSASSLTWTGTPTEGSQQGTTGTASIVAGTFTTIGRYPYTVEAANGKCKKDTTVIINVIEKTEEIAITAEDVQACEGAGGTLTASATGGGTGGLSYRWEVISGNMVLESTTGPSVNIASAGPGTHRVTVYVTDKSADPAPPQQKTITVTVHTNPVIDPIVVTNVATNATGTTVEYGDELKLATSVNPGNATLTWTESGSGNSLLSANGSPVFTKPMTDTKTYTVTATANGTCTASREVTVTVNRPATGGLLELELEKKCADLGESMVLSMKATGGTTYSFTLKNNAGLAKVFTGSGPWQHLIALGDQDTYFVQDFKAFKNGVEITPTKVVPTQIEALFYTTPSITITNGNNQAVCQGDALTLSASSQLGGTTYSWNNGVVNGEAFHPATSGVYTVTATSDKGCIATSDVSVTIIPKPTVTIGASPETICLGDTVILTAGGSATEFVWNNGQTGSPITVVPNVGGTIRYVVTGKEMVNGCTDTATVKVVVNEPPRIISASKAVRSIAIGKSVAFGVKASGKGLSYEWQRWTGSSWLTLYDASDDQPAVSGSHSDSLKLINVPKSWDGTKLQCVVTNSCGVADTTFTLNVKECFDILDVEWDMCHGIRPEKDPAVAIDGWYCPGSRIAICARLVLDDPDVELENAVYKWTVDGLSTTDGRWGEMKFISDSSILSWIPPAEWQDNITIALCAYVDGACDTISKSYLRLKAMKYTDLAWEMKTSVDPARMFCPGDTVTCWIDDPKKTAGLNPTYKWYNDIFDLEVEAPTHNKVVSLKNDQVVMAMGQRDSWMKVIMTPSPEICTREPHYTDTAFLQVKKFVEPSLYIDCADTIACRGDSVRMSAIYANAGLNPTFQWQRSIGEPFPGWNLGTKSHATVYLDEKDVWVKCVMKPSADVCYDKTKPIVDAIQIKVLQAEGSIQIACDMKDKEPGDELLFTSEVKDVLGDHKYEWMVNGRLAPEGDSEYSCNTLRSGDVVYCLVSGERLCQSRIQSNEIKVEFGRVTRDTVITIYRNERIQNLKLFKAGDEGRLFLIDKFPHDGIALLTLLGGQFNYVPNRNFVGVDYVHYLVKDKFDPSKVEEGHIYINVKENGLDNLPNVITPNGDGLNDEWHLETITGKYTDYEITIYNRIGNVVFRCKNNYTNDWNGQTMSNPNYEMPLGVLQSGIYTYVISLDKGQKKIMSWLEIRAGLSRGSYR